MVTHEHPKVDPAQLLEKIKILTKEEQLCLHTMEKLIQLSCWVLLVRLGWVSCTKEGQAGSLETFSLLRIEHKDFSTHITCSRPSNEQQPHAGDHWRPQCLIHAQRSKSAPALLWHLNQTAWIEGASKYLVPASCPPKRKAKHLIKKLHVYLQTQKKPSHFRALWKIHSQSTHYQLKGISLSTPKGFSQLGNAL